MSFLDEPAYPFHDPTAKLLWDILVEAYSEPAAVKDFVRGIGMRTTDMSWTKVIDSWTEVLEKAAKGKRLRGLVESAIRDPSIAGYHQQLSDLVARCDKEDAAAPAEPQDACLVHLIDRRIFMNRSGLRDNLKIFTDNQGDRVMAVDGPPASGRSYSWYLIQYVGQKTGAFDSYLIDITKWSDTAARPGDLARLIASELGWKQPEFDQTAQDETTSRILLAWLKGRARERPRPACLVFDGLDRPNVTEATLRFISDIATAAGNAELGEFRVVLLAFGRSLADQNVDPFVLRESMTPTGVPLADVRQAFQHVAEQGGTELSVTQIDQLLAELLKAPPTDPIPIKSFGREAGKLAFNLSRGSNG